MPVQATLQRRTVLHCADAAFALGATGSGAQGAA